MDYFITFNEIQEWCADQMEKGYSKALLHHVPIMIEDYLKEKEIKNFTDILNSISIEIESIEIDLNNKKQKCKILEEKIKILQTRR